MLMQRETLVLGLVVLFSVSASHPAGDADLKDMYHHHYPNAKPEELCTSLRRYMAVLLRGLTTSPMCKEFTGTCNLTYKKVAKCNIFLIQKKISSPVRSLLLAKSSSPSRNVWRTRIRRRLLNVSWVCFK